MIKDVIIHDKLLYCLWIRMAHESDEIVEFLKKNIEPLEDSRSAAA
jgi:hypothetical protein